MASYRTNLIVSLIALYSWIEHYQTRVSLDDIFLDIRIKTTKNCTRFGQHSLKVSSLPKLLLFGYFLKENHKFAEGYLSPKCLSLINRRKRETSSAEATYWEFSICFQVIRSLDTFIHDHLKNNWDHEYHDSPEYRRLRGSYQLKGIMETCCEIICM